MSTCATHSFFVFLSPPCSAGTIFSPFIVSVQRGNNIFLLLSSPRGAVTIFSPFIVTVRRGNNIFVFYRRRAAREQYFCRFIVTVRRGNDISAVSVLAVLLQIHSRTVLAFAGQLRAFRNVARTARGWRRASCRGENEKQPSEIE